MVEIPKDCVLQWAGHAGYITERFSGLLARQALVDVTLICDEQKLRVHKLVLASNSIYFEEILQQDLGQEPIILLNDLDFEILKAMVEFMYCGETTISHQHLSSLYTAAQIFQVKKLVSVIDTIIDSKKISENLGKCLKQQKGGDCSLKAANVSLMENDYVRVRCELSTDESTSLCAGSNNNDISSTKRSNRSFESTDMIDGGEHDLEHTLYEESVTTDVGKEADVVDTSDAELNISAQCDTIAATTVTVTTTTTTITASTTATAISMNQVRCIISNRDETPSRDPESPDLKPILYEQCCDLSCDVNERDGIALSRFCLPQAENDRYGSSTDVPSTVGRCVKVYTPKRRKSVDEARNKLVHTRCNLVPTTPSSTDSIDLLDEPSANDVPVTLLSSLDMESAEYILSLSAESIQSIVGGTISDRHTVIGCREMSAERDERLNLLTNDADCVKPVLRRSTRLSQQESDETASNGSSLTSSGTATEKQFKKSHSPNGVESCAKTKRRGKEDRKVPDHGVIAVATSANRRNKRSNSKLIVKRSNKSSCIATAGKEKEEPKTKANSKFKADNAERSMMLDQSASLTLSVKSNTHERIDRALWGDLSDALDDRASETDLLAYPSNTEIPFAVGLLPLRAALEKMQATPDYQPRKTRSSVAPMKQETASLKRKSCTSLSHTVVLSGKKQSCNNNNESPNTVCHIQIRAAPSQCMKGRRRFLSDSIASLPTTEIADDRQ
ncbi:uncharacterized protein LOC105283225 isoform X1 [Ooceraea biroi]|nr:uncharacterized protein LOC105283225 isoform X1 [Ooceraea biroi]